MIPPSASVQEKKAQILPPPPLPPPAKLPPPTVAKTLLRLASPLPGQTILPPPPLPLPTHAKESHSVVCRSTLTSPQQTPGVGADAIPPPMPPPPLCIDGSLSASLDEQELPQVKRSSTLEIGIAPPPEPPKSSASSEIDIAPPPLPADGILDSPMTISAFSAIPKPVLCAEPGMKLSHISLQEPMTGNVSRHARRSSSSVGINTLGQSTETSLPQSIFKKLGKKSDKKKHEPPSFLVVMNHDELRKSFVSFLEKQMALENIHFIDEANNYPFLQEDVC